MTTEAFELRAADLGSALRRYLALLRAHEGSLNGLNVYPVPDGDTGSNMTRTVEAVVVEADGAADMEALMRAVSHGSLMGAQGNSGIILSQVFRALAATLEGRDALDGPGFVEACNRATAAAYEAVGRPVEGTILTVLRETTEAVSSDGHPGREILTLAYRRAEESLRRTPDLLPVLREAGVVDAGGAGLLLWFAALVEETTGATPELPADLLSAEADVSGIDHDGREASVADLRYEVMFLLEGEADAGDRLRSVWRDLGDSIVVVGGDGAWNCHIHTDGIGPAIEAGIMVGRPHRIVVTDLVEQAADEHVHGPAGGFDPLPEARKAKVGVVAVVAGDGLVELYRQYGVQAVVHGGQTMNPSVGDLLAAVEAAPARSLIVLPNNKNVVPAAEELDSLTKKTVYVVPTRSVPEGIAALFAYEPHGPAESIAAAMRDAAGAISTGEMTRAVRDATTPAGAIREGDWLGLVDGKVRVITGRGRVSPLRRRLEGWVMGARRSRRRDGARALQNGRRALLALVEQVVGEEHDIVTLITGREADAAITDAAVEWLGEHRPGATVQVVEGGQPLYPYLVGAE